MNAPGPAPDQGPAERDAGQASSLIRANHFRGASKTQRLVDRITRVVRWPGFTLALSAAVVLWIAGNLLAIAVGAPPLDPPPFAGLEVSVGVLALMIAALILATQSHEGELSAHYDQLILELTILNDQKVSKIIALIEEARRDNPLVSNRTDIEARALSEPADPHGVLDAIKADPVPPEGPAPAG